MIVVGLVASRLFYLAGVPRHRKYPLSLDEVSHRFCVSTYFCFDMYPTQAVELAFLSRGLDRELPERVAVEKNRGGASTVAYAYYLAWEL